jgi:hypothetical protein
MLFARGPHPPRLKWSCRPGKCLKQRLGLESHRDPDYVKAKEADPAQDEQGRAKLSAHAKDHSPAIQERNGRSSSEAGQMTVSPVPPQFDREANGGVFSIFYRCE